MVKNRIGIKANRYEVRILIRFDECERKLKLLI